VNPAVSVVIPTFNRSWGLKRAVAGVLAQTFADFELVVVDDSSSDDTPDVARSFADPRMQYHRQSRNVGVARNWGTGVELARGEFVALLMDDDRYEPEFLARRVSALRANRLADFAFGAYSVRAEDGKEIMRHSPSRLVGQPITGQDLVSVALAQECFVGATLYRTERLRSVWAQSESAGLIVDHAANLRLALRKGGAAVFVGGCDFVMAAHSEQLSQTKRDEVFRRTLDLNDSLCLEQMPHWTRRAFRRKSANLLIQMARGMAANGKRGAALGYLIRAITFSPTLVGGWSQLIRISLGHKPRI
jgi:glycosyltransferase involved in cell wall biosynthesis